MTPHPSPAAQTALQVAQQAIQRLASWAEVKLVEKCPEIPDAIARAWKLSPWRADSDFKPLKLLFDQVKLADREGQQTVHYWAPIAIADSDPPIPYPQTEPPDPAQLNQLKQQIKPVLEQLQKEDWNNLTLLMLILEKYTSYISLDGSNIAFFDQVRATSAIAAAIAFDPTVTHLNLVAGDLSGIQKFIYTISSAGALKSLRARSFYLELVTEEVVQQILEKLDLPRTSVIYAGGGNLYLLAPLEGIESKITDIHEQLNKWLKDKFQSKVFLALAYHLFETEKVADQRFAEEWDEAIRKLTRQKSQKFLTQLRTLLEPRGSYTPCKVCHRDDMPEDKLDRLNKLEPDSVLACETCRDMFELGNKLFAVSSIVRSRQAQLPGAVHTIDFKFSKQSSDHIYYHLFSGKRPVIANPELTFLINNWALEDYQFCYFRNKAVPLLLGNYYQKTAKPDEKGFITAEEMADTAEGIKRVGYLRMDVDKLGQIFAKGLGKNYSLPRLAGLSRQISYFFKVYLNSLAGDRQTNFLDQSEQLKFKALTESDRQNLLFIYAGGDDLFISGAWDEIVEFAFDVYQSFRAYTGNNPDITLSGGISIEDVKFPLYQAAEESGEAEDAAKGNGRNSLGLFGSAFKWSEWLGADQTGEDSDSIIEQIQEKEKASNYWNQQDLPAQPSLLGVLPFVSRIQPKLQSDFSRSFIRNLLITAELQEQRVRDIQEQRKHEEYKYQLQDIQYYLHLPQIAYTLARLPSRVRNDITFEPIRTSLKSPYNAPYFRAIATWIELLTRQSNP